MRNKFLATTSLVFAAALAFSAPANANGVGTTVEEARSRTRLPCRPGSVAACRIWKSHILVT